MSKCKNLPSNPINRHPPLSFPLLCVVANRVFWFDLLFVERGLFFMLLHLHSSSFIFFQHHSSFFIFFHLLVRK